MRTIIKYDIYENRIQYDLGNDLWEAIRNAINVEVKTIKKFIKISEWKVNEDYRMSWNAYEHVK